MTGFDSVLFDQAIATERRRARRTQIVGYVLATALLTPVGWVLATLMELERSRRLPAAIGLAAAAVAAGLVVIVLIQWLSGQAVISFMQPGGRSRAGAAHSKAEALAMAGRIDEATAEFEASRSRGGNSVASLRAEAELHSTASGDPRRAESLLLAIRRSPDATVNDELYASHRLIDLYLGALEDSGRVMVELRRMADRFPDTIDGQGALTELKRRRAESSEAA
jgi:hypothetical protein